MELTSRKLMLSGLIILGFICTAYGKPASDDDNDDYTMQQDDDYQYEDDNVSPHLKTTAAVLKSTVPPFFDIPEYTKYVRPGENAILDCPVKNLAENNVVMWLNETTVIAQSKTPTSGRVSVSKNYTLTIFNATTVDSHDYFCLILPQRLQLRAKLHVSQEQNHLPEGQQSQSQKHDQPSTKPSSVDRAHFSAITFLTSLTVLSIFTADKFLRI